MVVLPNHQVQVSSTACMDLLVGHPWPACLLVCYYTHQEQVHITNRSRRHPVATWWHTLVKGTHKLTMGCFLQGDTQFSVQAGDAKTGMAPTQLGGRSVGVRPGSRMLATAWALALGKPLFEWTPLVVAAAFTVQAVGLTPALAPVLLAVLPALALLRIGLTLLWLHLVG